MTKMVLMPAEPPDVLDPETEAYDFDMVLFELCRRDDYVGLYREFVRRFSHPSPTEPKTGPSAE